MIDFKTFYERRYSYTKSDLKRIAKEGLDVIIANYSDPFRANCYYDNIIETAFYADGSATYDEMDFFNSTSSHKPVDKAELFRLARQAWDFCEYYNTIPNDLRTRPSDVINAVIVITIAACLVDGSLNAGEKNYINKMIGYTYIY